MTNFSKIEEDEISAEIKRLHDFFVDWFNGVVPETEDQFKQFSTATSADFVIAHPSGELESIENLTSSLYNAYKKRLGLDIKVKNMCIRHKMGDYYLATYEEWQLEKGDTEWGGRLSSVLLSRNKQAPAGLLWHHVHETWLPEGSQL